MARLLLFFLLALPLIGKAQITSVGLAAGVSIGSSSEYSFQAGNYLISAENINEIGRLSFVGFVEHDFLSKYSFSHSITLLQYGASYFVSGSPVGNQGVLIGVFAIKYNLLLRLFNKGGIRLLAGPGIDANIVAEQPPSTFSDNDLNEVITQLGKTINPIVYNLAAELGYRAGRIDIALKYNHSLNSLTNSLAYQGENYAIPTRQAFLFLNIGFLVFDKNLRGAKNN